MSIPASDKASFGGAKKSVLLIAPQPFYQERGTPMNVRLMASILGESGYLVDLIVFPTGNKITIPGVTQITLPNLMLARHIPIGFSLQKLFFDCLLLPWCAAMCLKKRYRVIHGVEEGGFIAVLLGKLFRLKSIYDMDSVMSEQMGSGGVQSVIKRLIKVCEKWSIRNASMVITVCSALTRKAHQQKDGNAVVQIEDIPLDFAFPVEKTVQTRNNEIVEQAARDFAFLGKKLLLYTGNLEKYQGIDLLLESWQLFIESKQEFEKYCLVIVGGTQKLKHVYEQNTKNVGIEQTVCFVGKRPAEEMSSWMALADCLISPRKEGENTPLKIYTYMASGKPIIATDITTHTQVLTNKTAFLAPPLQEALAEKIDMVFSDANEASKRGKLAKDLVCEKYSYDVFAQKLLEAYSLAEKTG